MDNKKNQQTPQNRLKVPSPPSVASATPNAPDQGTQGKVRSEAPNASFETGAGQGATGYDSPPITSSQLSNLEVESDEQHDDAIYPPGGAPDKSLKRRYSEPSDNNSSEGGE